MSALDDVRELRGYIENLRVGQFSFGDIDYIFELIEGIENRLVIEFNERPTVFMKPCGGEDDAI